MGHLEFKRLGHREFKRLGLDYVLKVLPCEHYTTGDALQVYGWVVLGSFVYGAVLAIGGFILLIRIHQILMC